QREDPTRPRGANSRTGRAKLRPLRHAMENKIAERCGARAPQSGKARIGYLATLPAVTPRFATTVGRARRSTTSHTKALVHLLLSPLGARARMSRPTRPPCRASCCGAEQRLRAPCV